MATTAELALYRQLQKVFKSTKHHLDRCEGALKDSTAAISALLNISEQFSLAQKVILTETPFAEDFPDVQERLLAKLERAVTNRLTTLQSVVKTFQEAHNKIAKLSSQTFLLYEKYSDQLSVSQVTVTKANIPSVSCMLKWTKDIDLKFHEEYVIRSHMVTAFNPQDVSTFEESWMDLGDLHRLVINTAYARVKFLLDEKL